MEKYKLKKDTFFYKAGTICKLTPKGNMVLDNCEGTCILHDYQFDSHPGLLDEWFEKIEEQKYGGRVREEGDACWYIDEEGDIIEDCWMPTELQLIIYKAGNMFWTEEEAEKELKRRKAYVILKEDTNGFEPDWNNIDHLKYFIEYNYYDSKLGVHNTWGCKANGWGLYFATMADAQASIGAHRQQWLDYLGVEEGE